MDTTLYADDNLSVFQRSGKYYIRYDAGAHQVEMREDEISREEALRAASGAEAADSVLFALQKRLIKEGVNPYKSNVV